MTFLPYFLVTFPEAGGQRTQDFVLGQCLHMPALTRTLSDVIEAEVDLAFAMGPGVALTGEVMWDQTQVNTGKKLLRVMLNMALSQNEKYTQ